MLAKLRSAGGQLGFQPRHFALLDEVVLENTRAARQASIYSSVLSGLMDARGIIVNNNMNVLLWVFMKKVVHRGPTPAGWGASG